MKKVLIILIAIIMLLMGCMNSNTNEVAIQDDFNRIEFFENREGEFLGINDDNSIQILLNEAVPVDFDYLNSLNDVIIELKNGDRALFTYIKKVEGDQWWYGHAVVNIEKINQ